MQFTYTYLKNAEMNGVTVGRYKGYDVVPTTKETLARRGESDRYIYLLYDDNNLLYRDGKVFGSVDRNGNVTEFMAKRYLLHYETYKETLRSASDDARASSESSENATAAGDDVQVSSIIADVALGLLVEDTLKGAREMSIDGLLKGFDYGLD